VTTRDGFASMLKEALGTRLEKLALGKLQPVTVAIVDSGIDARHPQLKGRIVRAFRVESDGKKQRVVKMAATRNADVYGHGTAVASIISRIAPNARIIDIRVLDADNLCTGETLIAGFRCAIESRARIINLSLAANSELAQPLRDLCETAYRRNQVVVAARRNMPLTDQGFPAEVATCIGVGMARLKSQFQLLFQGDRIIEFAAHGEEVVVAAAGGGETTMTGTSFATPAVSGLCALLTGAYPDLRPFDIKTLLRALSV